MNETFAQLQKKLEQMLPMGQWGLGQRQWMAKDGTYFCVAADIVDGEIILTELGERLSVKPAPAPAPKDVEPAKKPEVVKASPAKPSKA